MQEEIENNDNEENEEELFEHYRFKVDLGQEVLRIDKFLLDRLPNTSRNKIQVAAKNGNIVVNGLVVKPNYRVKPKDEVAIVLPYPIREIELIAQNIPIEIIYEDESFVIVNKPFNMVVHPGYGNYTGTMVNALVYHFDNLPHRIQDYFGRPGLVHRLDKNTTGIMVVAKTEFALTNLAKQFYDRTTERRYHALVWGDIEQDGTVIGNIGRCLKNRKVMDVFPEGEYGKHAITHYKVLERFGLVTLIECKLETGRTHQIRAHLKSIGHPLFNDNEYGGDRIVRGTSHAKYKKFIENCFELLPGQALHAKTLGLRHPHTNEFLSFDSELNSGFAQIIEKWRKYVNDLE
ncbi:MAG: RluA family pseudouridine synthase [Flavobacteriia bacterium]|nr:RluA family pseudouridine synthase [Flavobacteriia bacterium]